MNGKREHELENHEVKRAKRSFRVLVVEDLIVTQLMFKRLIEAYRDEQNIAIELFQAKTSDLAGQYLVNHHFDIVYFNNLIDKGPRGSSMVYHLRKYEKSILDLSYISTTVIGISSDPDTMQHQIDEILEKDVEKTFPSGSTLLDLNVVKPLKMHEYQKIIAESFMHCTTKLDEIREMSKGQAISLK